MKLLAGFCVLLSLAKFCFTASTTNEIESKQHITEIKAAAEVPVPSFSLLELP